MKEMLITALICAIYFVAIVGIQVFVVGGWDMQTQDSRGGSMVFFGILSTFTIVFRHSGIRW